jgi:hypothetical protein
MAASRVGSGRRRLLAGVVGIGSLALVAVLSTGFASPDRLLERSYARVAPLGQIHLDEPVADRTLPVTRTAGPVTSPPVLLVDGVAVHTAVLNEPLVAGARLRLAPGTLDSREIEVLEVAEMDAPVVGLPGVRLQLVKARALDGAEASETVRLIFTVRDGEPAKVVPVSVPPVGKVL